MKEQIGAPLSENKELKVANDRLTNLCGALTKQTKFPESRITRCEQNSRNANVELQSVTVKENESACSILQKQEDTINESITAANIKVCHRVPVPRSDTNKNIAVLFAR